MMADIMKIVVLGDVHGKLDVVSSIIKKENPGFILCTGDLENYGDILAPFYFIHGNHEDFEVIRKIDAGLLTFRNLFHIKSGDAYHLGAALRIAGLGGNYSPAYYCLKSSELPGARKRHFTQEEVERCKRLCNIDIFLCHEAPAGIGIEKRGKDVGIQEAREVLEAVRPGYFFFGHHHHFAEIDFGVTKVISLDRIERSYVVVDSSPSGMTHAHKLL